MRLRCLFLVSLFFLLTFVSQTVQAVSNQNSKHIRLTYPAKGYPPYTTEDKTGIMVDIFRHIANRLGYGVEVHLLPAKRTERALNLDEADCRTKAQVWVESPEQYLWTNPVLRLDDHLITRASEQSKPIKSIGMVRGYSYPNIEQIAAHQSKLEKVEVKSPYELLGLLQKNRVDAIVLNQNVAKWYITRHTDLSLALFDFGKVVHSVDFTFQCRKSEALAQFVTHFNEKLREINATGYKQTIVEHYFKEGVQNN